MASEKKDLDQFLDKIDKIDEVIKELATDGENGGKVGMEKADALIEEVEKANKRKQQRCDNTGVNQTMINQAAFDKMSDTPQPPPDPANMEQESFMRVLEADAQERTERRRKSEAVATKLKDQGNAEYQAGNYEAAVKIYSEALSQHKLLTAVWTNRALAYIKLDQYEKAISDCEWALRVYENCLKAHMHMGTACLGLKRYEDAIECYNKVKDIDPKKEAVVKEYIHNVELARQREKQEEEVSSLFTAGDAKVQCLADLIKRVNQPDQLPLYYSGGLRVIKEVLTDDPQRTLFRTSSGLRLTLDHCLINRICSACPLSLSREELDLCACTLETLQAACTAHEENVRCLLELPGIPAQIQKFLDTRIRHSRGLRQAAINLLHTCSLCDTGRARVVSTFDVHRLLVTVFGLLRGKSQVALNATSFLNNLALDNRFKAQLRDQIEESVLPAFEKLMVEGANNPAVMPSIISTVTNLCGDTAIRRKMQTRRECWDACLHSLTSSAPCVQTDLGCDTVHAVLGLLINLSVETSPHGRVLTNTVCQHCLTLLTASPHTGVQERCCAVIGQMLPGDPGEVEDLCSRGFVQALLKRMKNGSSTQKKLGIKCLVTCTQHSTAARHTVTHCNGGVQQVCELLGAPDEATVGNAALGLGHLTQEPGVSESLADSNIMMDLLVIARDGKRNAVQHNCAILIAKLSQTSPRHLERLRELKGLGILHDVIKHVKD